MDTTSPRGRNRNNPDLARPGGLHDAITRAQAPGPAPAPNAPRRHRR